MTTGVFEQGLADGLRLRATTDPHSPLLDHFYAGYDRAFVLPDERETLAGFRDCMALNSIDRFFGRRHSELIVTIDNADGQLLGGANFLATAMVAPGGPPVSVALNYMFVEQAARGRGLSRLLVDQIGRMANLSLLGDAAATSTAIFIEQNDPLALSDEDYRRDSEHAGIDQVDRLAIWAHLGARLVDFAYVQPALSADQAADDGLIYAALRFPGDSIPPRWFHDHLESFFGVSVRKGQPIVDDNDVMQQLGALDRRCEPLALWPVGTAIDRLRAMKRRPQNDSFRTFVKER